MQHASLKRTSDGLTCELIAIDRLIPYARNARTHSEAQVAQIAGSMTEFGFVNPVLVGEDNVLIAGHGRVMAARLLGMRQVPAIRLSHLSETQRRALIIADNKITENAGWDEGLLRQELLGLQEDDFDLPLLGFTDEELEEFFCDDESVGNTDEDVVPELPQKPISVLGDLWLCGEHKIYCGDATLIDSYTALLGGSLSEGELADMVFTDPPYNVNYGHLARGRMRGKVSRYKSHSIQNDNLGKDFERFLYEVCTNLMMVCKGAMYICMAASELYTLHHAFSKAGGRWSTFLIWAKHHFSLGRSDYQRQYESILYGWKEGNDHFWCGARDQSDVWFANKPARNKLHPTMKPVELVERALYNSSKPKDIVLDAFGGSGTTMIACEKANRRGRLIELEPKYVDVTIKRWQEFTGDKATLAATGQEFGTKSLETLEHERLGKVTTV